MLDVWKSSLAYKLVKKEKKNIAGIKELKTDEEKADYLYNYFRLWQLTHGRPYVSMMKFNSYFRFFLDEYDVKLDNVLLTDWYSEPLEQLASYDNATWAVRTKGGKVYVPTIAGTDANTVPAVYQGRQAIVSKGKKAAKGPFEAFTMPTTTADDNQNNTLVKACIDGTMMNVSREETNTGNKKTGIISTFASSEQLAKAWGKPYGISTYSQLIYDRKAEVLAQEMAENDKKRIEENFREEVKGYHDRMAEKINKTEVTAFGEPGKPFTYVVDYTMGGMVKRAGNNLVVSVGELVGQQKHIEGNARKRDCDVFHPFPCTYTTEISLQIPAGYKVAKESLSGLTANIDNAAASFSSSARVEGNTLKVSFRKVYKQTLVPLANWPDELQVLDAAFKFQNSQIVLRKL